MLKIDLNEKFLKTLTVLYVEDDDIARAKLGKTLGRFFKNVLLAEDGQVGLNLFKEHSSSIDLIVSDINMPNLDGLDMLEQIREIDAEIPCVYTTARNESEQLLRAIELGVSSYVIKPIDTKALLKKIDKICEAQYNKQLLGQTQNQLEHYMNTINNVAVISKTDHEGKITFINSGFNEITGYTLEEIQGKDYTILHHPDMTDVIRKEMTLQITKGEPWKGSMKNIAKDGSAFYCNCSVFPIKDEITNEIDEFIFVRFITTDEEKEKREFHKRVIKNIKTTKQNEIDLKTEIKKLQKEKEICKNEAYKLKELLLKEKDRSTVFLNQLNACEADYKDLKAQYATIVENAQQRQATLEKR